MQLTKHAKYSLLFCCFFVADNHYFTICHFISPCLQHDPCHLFQRIWIHFIMMFIFVCVVHTNDNYIHFSFHTLKDKKIINIYSWCCAAVKDTIKTFNPWIPIFVLWTGWMGKKIHSVVQRIWLVLY